MTGNHQAGARCIKLACEVPLRKRCPHEPVGLVDGAMHHAGAKAGHAEGQVRRQACHPGLACRRQRGDGMGIPARRGHVTGRAFRKPAATVLRAGGDLLFHVALDGVPAARGDELRGGFGIRAVGNCIASMDDMAVGNAGLRLKDGQRLKRLQVAIGATADEQGRVNRAEISGGQWEWPFSSAPSSMGWPCGVAFAARSQASLRSSRSARLMAPLASTIFSSAASQWL